MPRKPKPRKHEGQPGEIHTAAETLAEHHPEIAEAAQQEDYKAPPAPTMEVQPEPLEPSGKSWAQTVRPWDTHGSRVKWVTFKVPRGPHGIGEQTGIAFPDNARVTPDEKLFLQHTMKKIYGRDEGFQYYGAHGVPAWGITRTPENDDIAKEITAHIDGLRMAKARENGR